jgi:hypothetical protein
MYIYCVTNYKTVALYLIIIKETLDLIKLSPGKSDLTTHIIHVTLITKTMKRDYCVKKLSKVW